MGSELSSFLGFRHTALAWYTASLSASAALPSGSGRNYANSYDRAYVPPGYSGPSSG